MVATKNVNGVEIEMTPAEEAELAAWRAKTTPIAVDKRESEKLLDALIAESIIPAAKRAAILARLS